MLDRLAGKPEEDDNAHAEAKMQVLHELRNMAMDMMGDKVKDRMPMHVDVAAPDAEGLQKGLSVAQHLAKKGPLGPPDSLNADKDSGYGEHLDSKEPHQGSNHSEMDSAAQDDEDQTEEGRSEPNGDEGEPDQHMLNPHRNQHADNGDDGGEHADDMDDMSHEEMDQMMEDLKAAKQAKLAKDSKSPKKY